YYILQGEGRMHVGDEVRMVYPGQAVVIPIDGVQFIENTGAEDLVFLCIVDPAWRAEDETVLVGDSSLDFLTEDSFNG
ncbi:MAG: cupin domain-containing protein, partial [Candidatus Delongbacteria bacterium]|nr:cupin domain-containing protein [Candidatus Delongbacteria bacterium]